MSFRHILGCLLCYKDCANWIDTHYVNPHNIPNHDRIIFKFKAHPPFPEAVLEDKLKGQHLGEGNQRDWL